MAIAYLAPWDFRPQLRQLDPYRIGARRRPFAFTEHRENQKCRLAWPSDWAIPSVLGESGGQTAPTVFLFR